MEALALVTDFIAPSFVLCAKAFSSRITTSSTRLFIIYTSTKKLSVDTEIYLVNIKIRISQKS